MITLETTNRSILKNEEVKIGKYELIETARMFITLKCLYLVFNMQLFNINLVVIADSAFLFYAFSIRYPATIINIYIVLVQVMLSYK